jgi:hypothetical protein
MIIRAPSPPLAPFAERLGHYAGELAGGWEPVPPAGTDHLLVNLGSGRFHWQDGAGPAVAWVRGGAVVVPPGAAGRVAGSARAASGPPALGRTLPESR